ncbi:unnamed protein product, partial [Polarella glacialis]
ALMCLAEDFQSLRSAVCQHFQVPDAAEVRLLPPDHPMCSVMQWGYLDQYLEAHGYTPNEVGTWCKRHPEYPLRLHKALLEYTLQSNPKAQKQFQSEVEACVAGYIDDEGAGFALRM